VSNCINRRKLVPERVDRGGTLRYAWLRAPPLRHAIKIKPKPHLGCLTQEAPYEGGQRCFCAVPTIRRQSHPEWWEHFHVRSSNYGGRFCPPYALCSRREPLARPASLSLSSGAHSRDPVASPGDLSPQEERGEVVLNTSRWRFEILQHDPIKSNRPRSNPARRPCRRPATPVGPCGPPIPCCGSRSAWRPASP
jgi:hypothetical protein